MTLLQRGARAALSGFVLATLLLFPRLAPADTEQRFSAWITGYTYWDNSPPGSAAIARPVVHDEAGGIGTWEDPITIAVGQAGEGWHFPPGTRIYLEDLRKYAVVEDLCGACGKGHRGLPHFDLYIGGEDTSAHAATLCAMQITAAQEIVVNPDRDYPVLAGEVAETCGAS